MSRKVTYPLFFAVLLVTAFLAFSPGKAFASDLAFEGSLIVAYAGGEGASGEPWQLEAVEFDAEITLPESVFYLDGHDFAGWTDGEGTYMPGETYRVISDVTFTALWSETEAESMDMGIMSSPVFCDLPMNVYTIYGSDDDDIIVISSLPGGIIQVAVQGGNTYQISNKTKLILNGGEGDDIIYFNVTAKSTGLEELVILGGLGNDIVRTELTGSDSIDLAGVSLLIKAEQVLFEIEADDSRLEFNVDNLNVQAAPTEASQFYASQTIKVVFRNIDFQVAGDFIVDATSYISNGQEVETGYQGTIYEIIISSIEQAADEIVDTVVEGADQALKTVYNAATIAIEVEIDTSIIAANNVAVQTINEIEMKTGSGVLPVTVTMADLVSKVTVSGSSLIQSAEDILLKSIASVNAVSDASSTIAIPVSVAVMEFEVNVAVIVTGTSQLLAGGDIMLLAENRLDGVNLAYGGGSTDSGAFVAVTNVSQSTKAALEGQASVSQGTGLTISSVQACTTQSYAESGATAYLPEEDEEGPSFPGIMNILASLLNPTSLSDDDPVKLISSDALEGFASAFGSIAGLGSGEDGTSSSALQLVGAVAVAKVDTSNIASLSTTNPISISGLLTILAEAASHNRLIADASAVQTADGDENEEISFGLGVGVAVGIARFRNHALVGLDAQITVNALQLKALSGDNLLSVGAKAGHNEADFGIGGALAVNLYDGETRVEIGDGGTITFFGSNSNLTLEARDASTGITIADASGQDEDELWQSAEDAKADLGKPEEDDSDESTGIGAGVAVSIFENNVLSRLGATSLNGLISNLTVTAASSGKNNTSAAAGAEGGICIVPVVAINLVSNYVGALVEPYAQAIMVVGDVLISAEAIRASETEANAEAGGENVAVGAAVAIALIEMEEEAVLDRSIGSPTNRAASITVTATGVSSNDTSAYAGKSGGKPDSEDSQEEDEGSIKDIQKKGMGTVKDLLTTMGQEDKDSTDKAQEQDAETSEGKLAFAASLALNIFDGTTLAAVGKSGPVIIYTGDLTIVTATNKDAIANANASATSPADSDGTKVGIGAAASILLVKTSNNAVFNGELYASGSAEVKTIMHLVEESDVDEHGQETTRTDGEHNYGSAAQSGAGGSVFSLAGAVALSFIDNVFQVIVTGIMDVLGDIDFGAVAEQRVETIATAGAVKTIAGKSTKKKENKNSDSENSGIGIGASFAMTMLDTKVSVRTTDAVLKSGGNTRARASFVSTVETKAESGDDVIEDDEGDPEKLGQDYDNLQQEYSKTSLDAAVAIAIVEITVEAIIGAAGDAGTVNLTVGGDLVVEAEVTSTIKTTARSTAEATNAAAGAAVSLNIVGGMVRAEVAAYAEVAGTVVIKANAWTVDESDAYATAKGVQLERYEDKLGISADDLLSGNLSPGDSQKTASLQTLSSGSIGDKAKTKDVDQSDGSTEEGLKISIAAAIAVNIVQHDVFAGMTGKLKNASAVAILAESENNFVTYATGVAVSNGNAISVAVAVAINNSQNTASLGEAKSIAGDISVKAITRHNLSEGYQNKIAAQAVAGSKGGTDGKFGAAGAVAVLVSNAQTKAYIAEAVSVDSQGTISVEAWEKSKLAIRAWAASLISKELDVEDLLSGNSDGSSVTGGIGAAFAILWANNRVIAWIGDAAQVTAKAVSVAAIKEKVDAADYDFSLDQLLEAIPLVDTIKNAFSQESDDQNTQVETDFEIIELVTDGLNMDLVLTAADYANYLASNNYYAEAAGGSLIGPGTDAKFAGAGSFIFVYFATRTAAYIGDNAVINIREGGNENSLRVYAASETNAKVIGGSVATGGDLTAGVTAVVLVSSDEVVAYLGQGVTVSGARDIEIRAEASQDYLSIAVAASLADKKGIAGIVNVIVSGNKAKAFIGGGSAIVGSSNLTIGAKNNSQAISVLGGVAYGQKLGVGASCLFLTLSNETEAYIGNEVWLNIGPGTIQLHAAASESIISVSVNGAASQGVSVSVGPAIKIIESQVQAYIGSNAQIGTAGLEIWAQSRTEIIGIAGSVSAALGKAAVGAVNDTNDLQKTVQAYVGQGTVIEISGDIDIKAVSLDKIFSYVLGVAASQGVSVECSVAIVIVGNDVRAYIADGVTINTGAPRAGDISVTASADVELLVVAGGLSGSTGSAAVGVSAGIITFEGVTHAYVGNGVTMNVSGLLVRSRASQDIVLIVASGAASDKVSASGAVAVLVFAQETKAFIGNGASINSQAGIVIAALDSTDLTIVTNVAGVGTTAAAGAAVLTTVFEKTVAAYVGLDTTIHNESDDAIQILAQNDVEILLVAVGLGGSASVAAEGSFIVLVLKDNVTAYIAGNTDSESEIITDGSITLTAATNLKVLNIAGSAVGAGKVAMGIALVVTTLEGVTGAFIGSNARVTASGNDQVSFCDGSIEGNMQQSRGILIAAVSFQDITNWVMSGGIGGYAAVTGSVNVLVFDQTTEAYVHQDAVLTSGGDIILLAMDDTAVQNRVGTAGISGKVAIGVASDTVVFAKKVKAIVLDGSSLVSEGNIIVHANSRETIHVVVAGIGGAGIVAVNGSASVIVFENIIIAGIGTDSGTDDKYASADAEGSIVILAENAQELTIIAGSANVAGFVAVAAGASVLTMTNTVQAGAGRHAHLNAWGLYDVLFYTGEANRKKDRYRGLLIGAYSSANINQVVLCASGSGAVAGAGAVATTITKTVTQARIAGSAAINQGNRQPHQQQSVRVIAVSESSIDVLDGGAAVSLFAGIGAAAVVVVADKLTVAEIMAHAKVFAQDSIELIARTQNNISTVVVALGGGVVGISGSASVVIISDTTLATVADYAQLVSGRDVLAQAFATHTFSLGAGSAAGGVVAVGGAAVALVMTAITRASIGDYAQITAGENIILTAISREYISAIAAGAAASAGVAATGSVVLVILTVTTQALVGSGAVLTAGNELNIHAGDFSLINGYAGGAAFAAAAGVGAAVDVILFRNTVAAGIGDNCTVTAGFITVLAEADRNIMALAVMLAGGCGAVSGSVVVISVGAPTSDSDTSTALKPKEGDNNTVKQSQADVDGALNNSLITLDNDEHSRKYIDNANATIMTLSIDVNSYFVGASVADKTTAYIGNGGTVEATVGDITVISRERTRIEAAAGAAAAGLGALGGAVVVVTLHGTAESYTGGTIIAPGNVTVRAENLINVSDIMAIAGTAGVISLGGAVTIVNVTGTTRACSSSTFVVVGSIIIEARGRIEAYNIQTYAGAVGGLGLGAAVVLINITGNVMACLDQAEVITAESVHVGSSLDSFASLNAVGAAGGVVAVGICIAQVKVHANVTAYANADIQGVSSVEISAQTFADIVLLATAAAGGVVAGSGAEAELVYNPNILAWLAGNVEAAGDITVKAVAAIGRLTASAQGAAVALGESFGVALARVDVSPVICAYIGTGAVSSGGDIFVRAEYNLEDSGSITARAYAGAGALLVGASGASARIVHAGSVRAFIQEQNIVSAGNILVLASGMQKLTAQSQGLALAGVLAVGAVFVSVTNKLVVEAYIVDSDIDAADEIIVHANNESVLTAVAIGTAGGLLAAEAAQTANVDQQVFVHTYVAGNDYSLKSLTKSITILSHNLSRVNIRAQGCTVAGFVAGGLTITNTTIDNDAKVSLYPGILLNAHQDIIIAAYSFHYIDSYASASAIAFGGSANDVSATLQADFNTTVEIAAGATLLAAGNILIQAISDKYHLAYATAHVGGTLAYGVVRAIQTITDNVWIILRDDVSIIADGYIYLYTNSRVPTDSENSIPTSRAVGGAGGLIAGTSTEARLDTTVNSTIETKANVRLQSHADDVILYATGIIASRAFSSISFTIDGLSILATESRAKNDLECLITLGSGTYIWGINVTLHAEAAKVDSYASASSRTGSIINTQSRPLAELYTVATAKVTGTYITLTALNKLGIYATVNEMRLRTYSFGYTAGGTGSVISTCRNNVSLFALIDIQNGADLEESVLRGRDIEIYATSPHEDEVVYTKDARYQAETVTELVKQVVETVVYVARQVTERIASWLPWPFNKIFRWITKTILDAIVYFTEIMVEVILQSETDARNLGFYRITNNVFLNGRIYYGLSLPIHILIDAFGNIFGIKESDYVRDEGTQTITLKPFYPEATGSLTIKSHLGKVEGNVIIYTNSLVSELNIINYSDYHLVITHLFLRLSESEEAGDYTILCQENRLQIEDRTEVTDAPVILIKSTKGKDITFAGRISSHSAILRIETGGNIYMNPSALLEVNGIEISAHNVGTPASRFVVYAFLVEDSDGNDVRPHVTINASGSIYASILLRRFIIDSEGTLDLTTFSLLDGLCITSITASGVISLLLPEAALLIAEIDEFSDSSVYSYQTYEITLTLIEDAIRAYADYEKVAIDGLLYLVMEFDYETNSFVFKYYTDEEHTNLFVVPEGYRIIAEWDEAEFRDFYYFQSLVPQTGYRYDGGENDGQEFEYDRENFTVIYDEEEEAYYFSTKTLVTVTVDLPLEYLGYSLRLHYVDSIYYVDEITGESIDLTLHCGGETKATLAIQGPVTAEGNIQITASKADIMVTGAVQAGGSRLDINAGGKVQIHESGQITGDTSLTAVLVRGAEITTNKTESNRYDIAGKTIRLEAATSIGSRFMSLAVWTGIQGLTAIAGDSVHLAAYLAPLYVKQVQAAGEVSISATQAVVQATGASGVNIAAGTLDVSAGLGIGEAGRPMVISILNSIRAFAQDDIWLHQVSRPAIVASIISATGLVSFLSEQDILTQHLAAQTSATIQSSYGAILNGLLPSPGSSYTDAVILAGHLVLSAKTNIGEPGKYLVVETSSDGNVKITGATNVYLREYQGDMRLDALTASGEIRLSSEGSILNATGNRANITAHTTILMAGQGLGSIHQPLTIVTRALTAFSSQEMFIHSPGNLNLALLDASGQDIFLTSAQSVYKAYPDQTVTIRGGNQFVQATNNIGAKSNPVIVALTNGSTVTLVAGGSIYLTESSGAIQIAQVTAGGAAVLTAKTDISGPISGGVSVKARDIALTALGGSIGTRDNPLNLRGDSLRANAATSIYLLSQGDFNSAELHSVQEIILAGASILGGKATTSYLELNLTGSLGRQGSAFETTVQRIFVQAGPAVYISNTGVLAIKLIAAKLVDLTAYSIKGTDSDANYIQADILRLTLVTDIGTQDKPFIASVNQFSGKTTTGSIYFHNTKDLTLEATSAPGVVFLKVNGALRGIGLAVTADKFVFDAANVYLAGAANYLEGTSKNDVIYTNWGALTIGGADARYQGIKAGGKIILTVRSPLYLAENLVATGDILLVAESSEQEDSVLIPAGILVHSKSGSISIFAGDKIVITSGANLIAAAEVILSVEGLSQDSLIDVSGSIKAAATTIRGAQIMTLIITESMGSVDIIASQAGSEITASVLSLKDKLNINGSAAIDRIILDMQKLPRDSAKLVVINGNGGEDEFKLLLDALGSQNVYRVNGSGTLTVETTTKDEGLKIYHDRLTLDAGQGADTIWLSGPTALTLKNPGGDNNFSFYNTPCPVILESGSGNDSFQLGRIVSQSQGATQTTEGWLSRGTSHDLTIKVLGGNNRYTIYSAKGPVNIYGGSDTDNIILKTFIEIRNGKLRTYVQAPFFIDGGEAKNQLTIIKAAIFDLIMVRNNTIVGSGYNVRYENLEVSVDKFEPAEGYTASITTGQLITYSFIQLAESRILYLIFIFLGSSGAAVVWLMKKRTQKRTLRKAS